MLQHFKKISFLCFGILLFVSCATIPPQAKVRTNFDVHKYMGTWYEIARIDFRFEKNLNNTSASYTLKNDGAVEVLNCGFNVKSKEWKQALGKAKFRGAKDSAALKVSFFGPFYAGYNVIALDEGYNYALVAGKNLDYLWILSRDKNIPEAIKKEYLKIAQDVGYDTSRLLWVVHNQSNPQLHEK